MKEFFHSVKFKILIFIFCLLLGVMIYAAVTAGAATIPERILATVSKPFVMLSNAVSDGVNDFLDRWSNSDKYKSENEELRRKITELYLQTADYNDLKEENLRFQDLLKLQEDNDSLTFSAPCSIIGRNANDVYGGFTIDKGSDDGISLYDPVISTLGLVGRVVELAPSYARVETLFSPQVNVGVFTERSRITGIMENDIKYAQDGLCLMSSIPKDGDIRVGDVVITSGQGGVFPEKQLVGTVKEIFDDANGLSRHAVIEPIENPGRLTNVFVITDFKGKGISFED